MTGTNASQSLSGFGKSEMSLGGGAFSSSLKRLYGLVSFSQTNTPVVTAHTTPQHSDSEPARARNTSQPSDYPETAHASDSKRSTSPQQTLRCRNPGTTEHGVEFPGTGHTTESCVDGTSPDRAAAARGDPQRSHETGRAGNMVATDNHSSHRKHSPHQIAHSPPARDRTLVVARNSPVPGPACLPLRPGRSTGVSGSDSSDASQRRGRSRHSGSRAGQEVQEKGFSVSGENRSEDSSDERRHSQEAHTLKSLQYSEFIDNILGV